MGTGWSWQKAQIVGLGLSVLVAPCSPVRAQAEVGRAEIKVQRLPWAGVKLEWGDATLFVDAVRPDPDRHLSGNVGLEASTTQVFALITHLHSDHFDPDQLRKLLGSNGRVYCTPRAAPTVAAAGLQVRVVPLWEPQILGWNSFTVIPVPAADGYSEEQVSWVILGGGKRFFHGGDTQWHGWWWHIGRAYGPFDVVFLPINGVDFRRRTPISNVYAFTLNPPQAAAAADILGAKLAVPIHYGAHDPPLYLETPHSESSFVDAARERKVPVEVRREGEWLTFKPDPVP